VSGDFGKREWRLDLMSYAKTEMVDLSVFLSFYKAILISSLHFWSRV
jgi:hypothetical protein